LPRSEPRPPQTQEISACATNRLRSASQLTPVQTRANGLRWYHGGCCFER
jgi:hypothetical protein